MPSDRLNIGLIAPPWMSVPPPTYGGTEVVLDALARGLSDRGHTVTLFTTGDSTCPVKREWLYDRADDNRTGIANEQSHCEAAYQALADCDLIHDHTLAGPLVDRNGSEAAVVTTNHGEFNGKVPGFYRPGRGRGRTPLIALSHDQASRAPRDLPVTSVIHNGIDIERYEFNPAGSDYLLSISRMHPNKGIDRAIHIARDAGLRLVIAAKMRLPEERQYFEEVIEPLLGPDIEVRGEVCHEEKVELLGGARALLNPIRWPEPFGLAMIEAMACGTPVLASPRGAAPEIIAPGATGYLATTDADFAVAARAAGRLCRFTCRDQAESQFTMERMARQHENFYLRARHRRLVPTGC